MPWWREQSLWETIEFEIEHKKSLLISGTVVFRLTKFDITIPDPHVLIDARFWKKVFLSHKHAPQRNQNSKK